MNVCYSHEGYWFFPLLFEGRQQIASCLFIFDNKKKRKPEKKIAAVLSFRKAESKMLLKYLMHFYLKCMPEVTLSCLTMSEILDYIYLLLKRQNILKAEIKLLLYILYFKSFSFLFYACFSLTVYKNAIFHSWELWLWSRKVDFCKYYVQLYILIHIHRNHKMNVHLRAASHVKT